MRLTVVVLLIVSVGCSPKVFTTIRKSYPARPENASVAVYGILQTIPDSSEVLGSVSVEDTGFSTGCSYEQVLLLAGEATNKVGGNGLHLTYHREPNFWGRSCHRIGGEMLYIPDSTYFAYAAVAYPSSDRTPTGDAETKTEKTSFTYYINAGYAFLTSKMFFPPGYKGNPRQGYDANIGIIILSRTGLGGGIRYSGFTSSARYPEYRDKYWVHYIAPEFVLQQGLRKWQFRETVGLGYAYYSEQYGDQRNGFSGYGFHVSLGVEYKITPHIGIGTEVCGYSARFRAMDPVVQTYDPDSHGGLTRVSLNGGLRLYF